MSRILIAYDPNDALAGLRILLKGQGHRTDAVTSLAGVTSLTRDLWVRTLIGDFNLTSRTKVADIASSWTPISFNGTNFGLGQVSGKSDFVRDEASRIARYHYQLLPKLCASMHSEIHASSCR